MANPWDAFPALQRASEVLARRKAGKSVEVGRINEKDVVSAPSLQSCESSGSATAASVSQYPGPDHSPPDGSPSPLLLRPPPPPPPPTLAYHAPRIERSDVAVATDDLEGAGPSHGMEEATHGRCEPPTCASAMEAASPSNVSIPLPAPARVYPGGISRSNYWHADPFPRGFPLRMARPHPVKQPSKSDFVSGRSAHRDKRAESACATSGGADSDSSEDDVDSLWHPRQHPVSLSFAERVRRKAAADAMQRRAANAAIARAVVASASSSSSSSATTLAPPAAGVVSSMDSGVL